MLAAFSYFPEIPGLKRHFRQSSCSALDLQAIKKINYIWNHNNMQYQPRPDGVTYNVITSIFHWTENTEYFSGPLFVTLIISSISILHNCKVLLQLYHHMIMPIAL